MCNLHTTSAAFAQLWHEICLFDLWERNMWCREITCTTRALNNNKREVRRAFRIDRQQINCLLLCSSCNKFQGNLKRILLSSSILSQGVLDGLFEESHLAIPHCCSLRLIKKKFPVAKRFQLHYRLPFYISNNQSKAALNAHYYFLSPRLTIYDAIK